MIMMGAGTGLAPFRGFLQERAAPSLLFFGCRDPEQDQLYADELRELAKLASTGIRTVFSTRPNDGRRYVQHEMLARHDEVWSGICWSAAPRSLCAATRTPWRRACVALVDIYRQHQPTCEPTARFLEDIWGS